MVSTVDAEPLPKWVAVAVGGLAAFVLIGAIGWLRADTADSHNLIRDMRSDVREISQHLDASNKALTDILNGKSHMVRVEQRLDGSP
jgi:hypothetical protein